MYLQSLICISILRCGLVTAQQLGSILSNFKASSPILQNPIHAQTLENGYSDSLLQMEIFNELQKRLSPAARVLLHGEEEFEAINVRYTNYQRPTYIAAVKIKHESDIVETVNYARSRGIPFAVRSGGHSLTASLRRIQNAIVIDIRGLNEMEFNEKKRQMTIGGGVSTGEFANATYLQGMEVTVGSCPCTGVLGVSLGAGIGRLQGKYGYLHDNIISVRVLLANGTISEFSQENHPDIFWAIRGAGHNFGIAVSATIQVYPQENDGLHYVVDFEYNLDQVEELFETLNSFSSPMAEKVAFFVIGRKKGATGGPTINLNMVYAGPKAEAINFVNSFAALSPVFQEEQVVSWNSLPWATYRGLNNILCTPEGWARFPIKNFYAANVKRYDIPTMRSYFNSWADMNQKYDGQAFFSVMFESFPQQGVRRHDRDSTAFPWRYGADHFLMIEAASTTNENEQAYDEWLSKQQTAFVEKSGYGRLQQYVNYGNGRSDPPEALYGYEPWRLAKLRRLKEMLDPEGLFNGYQPILEIND